MLKERIIASQNEINMESGIFTIGSGLCMLTLEVNLRGKVPLAQWVTVWSPQRITRGTVEPFAERVERL